RESRMVFRGLKRNNRPRPETPQIQSCLPGVLVGNRMGKAKRGEAQSPRQPHGLNALRRAISTLGRRKVDKGTTVGKQLAAWRSDLLTDLGGIDSVSTQELALVEEAVKVKLLLNSAAG